jgi:hypothetical protein
VRYFVRFVELFIRVFMNNLEIQNVPRVPRADYRIIIFLTFYIWSVPRVPRNCRFTKDPMNIFYLFLL